MIVYSQIHLQFLRRRVPRSALLVCARRRMSTGSQSLNISKRISSGMSMSPWVIRWGSSTSALSSPTAGMGSGFTTLRRLFVLGAAILTCFSAAVLSVFDAEDFVVLETGDFRAGFLFERDRALEVRRACMVAVAPCVSCCADVRSRRALRRDDERVPAMFEGMLMKGEGKTEVESHIMMSDRDHHEVITWSPARLVPSFLHPERCVVSDPGA